MKIRLRIDTAVDTKDHAELIYNAILQNKDWFSEISDFEPSWLRISKCYHDETPTKPCEIWVEIINGKYTWQNGEPVP